MSTRKFNKRTTGPTRAEVLPVCPSCRADKCAECTSDDCGCSKPYHTPLGEAVDVHMHVKKHESPLLEVPAPPKSEQLDLPLPPRTPRGGGRARAAKKPLRAAWWFSKMKKT